MKTQKQIWHMAVTGLFAAMLCIYVLAIFYINFSQRPSFYVADMYSDVLVCINMWEQKTLFPENWVFGNQLYVMATPVLSALIYGITGDPFWSMAAASSVMAVLVIVSFDWMLKAAFPRPAERLFGSVSFLALVAIFGDAVWATNGWQLFFTMCSYYACYAINVFLAFGCYLRKDAKISPVLLGCVCLMSFAMGIQSLRQTAVMVLPLMAMEFFRGISCLRRQEPVRSHSLFVASAISASNLAGLVFKRFLNIHQVEIFGQIRLRSLRDIPGALWSSIKHTCALLFYFEEEPNVPCLLVLAVFVLFALILLVKTRHDTPAAVKVLFSLLLLSVLSIAGIATVTTMRVRSIYYFMLYPLLACLAVFAFSNRHAAVKTGMILLLCSVFCFSCLTQVGLACSWAHNRMYDDYYAISEDLLDRGFTTLYSRWDGCEKIAAASRGKLRAGFWRFEPFEHTEYLFDSEILMADPEEAAYVFLSQEEAELGIEKAGTVQVELIPVAEYPERDIYVYTAPVNLMQIFSPDP
ncbi:MAG: hypothetical protein ACI4PH_10415 [Faecousia sp.]